MRRTRPAAIAGRVEMHDEQHPGPSPAYDPWRAQQASGGESTPAPSSPTPQTPPPTRNADGSWTVHVPDDGGYPQPRRPLTAPVPVQPPQLWMQSAPAASAPPPPQQRRPRRLGLLLGIGIPVATLGIGALVAALIVPGVLVDRDAQAAADDYRAQVAAWEATYSDAALQPFAELDATAFDVALVAVAPTIGSGSYDDQAADASALQAACDGFRMASGDAQVLTAPTPSLRVVDGGERNPAYAQALAEQTSDTARFEAASGFAGDVAPAFDAIERSCSLALAQADADAAFATAYAAYLATLTVPQGGTERFDVSASEWFTFTCNADTGCASFVDRDARAATGAAWAAAFVAYEQALAATYRDHCPTADVQSACDAWAAAHDASAELAAAVGDAYRDEDVTGGAIAGDAYPAPDLEAAIDAYVDGSQAGMDAAGAETSAVAGVQSMLAVVQSTVDAEVQRIRDAAGAVLA